MDQERTGRPLARGGLTAAINGSASSMAGSNPNQPGRSSGGGVSTGRSATSPLLGKVIGGDFEIRHEIGRGGMGTVYEALQRSLDRIVAIKVLAGSVGLSGNAVIRFQREAQAAAKLHHSSIIPIYAHGDDDGIYYYAMQLVEGRSIIDIINEERGSDDSSDTALTETKLIVGGSSSQGDSARTDNPDKTVHVSHQSSSANRYHRQAEDLSRSRAERFDEIARLIALAADGLEYAHAHGVIHRDIKPHNLIRSVDGRCCIADFGLARVLAQPGVTTTGEFVGSPLYMSPEQISGGRLPVDHRTDIYSLGATLYEWLTLHPPFPGETREQVISSIIAHELKAPRWYDSSIPTDLETICLRSLEEDPNRRYRSAGEMSEDLDRYLKRTAIKAKREGRLARVRRWVDRNRAAVLAASVVLVIASIAMSALWRTNLDKQALKQKIVTLQQQDKSVMESLEESMPLESQALKIGGEFLSGLTKGITAMGGDEGASGGGIMRSIPTQAVFLAADDRSLLADLTNEFLEKQRVETKRRMALAPEGVTGASQADSYFRDGLTKTKPDEALEDINLALQAVQNNPALQAGVRFSELWYVHGLIHGRKLEPATMNDDANLLVRMAPTEAAGYVIRGLASLMVGDYSASVRSFAQAIAYEPKMPALYVALGAAQSRSGQFENAFDNFDRALALQPDHATAIRERGAALPRIMEAIDRLSAQVDNDPENPEHYDACVRRGELYALVGEYKAAVADFNRAIELDPTPSASLTLSRFMAISKLKEKERSGSEKSRSRQPGDGALNRLRSERLGKPERVPGVGSWFGW